FELWHFPLAPHRSWEQHATLNHQIVPRLGVRLDHVPLLMWTCSKCGEAIEDQFDSCWKCAAQPEQTSPLPEAALLRWCHYVFALLMSYLVPWLAVFFKVILSSRFRHLLGSSDFSILL